MWHVRLYEISLCKFISIIDITNSHIMAWETTNVHGGPLSIALLLFSNLLMGVKEKNICYVYFIYTFGASTAWD